MEAHSGGDGNSVEGDGRYAGGNGEMPMEKNAATFKDGSRD